MLRRRSVLREQQFDLGISDESAAALVDLLVASGSSPSKNLMEQERAPASVRHLRRCLRSTARS